MIATYKHSKTKNLSKKITNLNNKLDINTDKLVSLNFILNQKNKIIDNITNENYRLKLKNQSLTKIIYNQEKIIINRENIIKNLQNKHNDNKMNKYINLCAICLDNITNIFEKKTLECEHCYHKNCIKQVKNKKCPLCNQITNRI